MIWHSAPLSRNEPSSVTFGLFLTASYQQFFTALEQTVEELAKCFLLEFGENREFSYGRCRKARSFNDLYEGLKAIE